MSLSFKQVVKKLQEKHDKHFKTIESPSFALSTYKDDRIKDLEKEIVSLNTYVGKLENRLNNEKVEDE